MHSIQRTAALLTLLLATAAGATKYLPIDPVLIVGAGTAGTKVAHDLAAANVPFIVFEAGPTVGGRLQNVQVNGSGPGVELGANWLHGLYADLDYAHVALTQVGLRTIRNTDREIPNFYEGSAPVSDEALVAVVARVAETEPALAALVADAVATDAQLSFGAALRAAGFPLDRPLDAMLYRMRYTYGSGVNDHTMRAQDLAPEAGLTIETFAGDAAAVARNTTRGRGERAVRLESRRNVVGKRFADGAAPGSLTATPTDYFVKDPRGFAEFARWHLRAAGVDDTAVSSDRLRLSAPVTKIGHGAQPFVTLADNTTVYGSAVVCTASIGVLHASLSVSATRDPQPRGTIRFEPALGVAKRVAIGATGMGHVTKLFVSFSQALLTWDDSVNYAPVYAGDFDGVKSFFLLMNMNARGYFPGSHTVLLFSSEPFAARLAEMSDGERVHAALDFIRDLLGIKIDPGLVTGVAMTPYWKNPYLRGSYSFRPPGFTRDMRDDLQRSVGKLFFAGEAFGELEQTTVQAAWRSGGAVAQDVIAAVKSK